jgi:hypothetical protein
MRRGARLEARTQTRHLVADTFGRIVVVFRKGFGLAYNGDDSIGLLIAKHAYCISTSTRERGARSRIWAYLAI